MTVACEPDVPGTPIRTAGKVSDVVVGARTPIIIAKACEGSRPNTKGSTRAKPDVPPNPGKIPTVNPRSVPPNKNKRWVSPNS